MGKTKYNRSEKRKRRISKNIFGTKDKPRISVYASNVYTYAQVIDDQARQTLAQFSSLNLARIDKYKKEKKVNEAKKVGLELANKIKKIGIKAAVFDRGRHAYKGRVKALAEGLREGGVII